MKWLERPQLTLSIVDRARLYGLSRRAQFGDAAMVPAPGHVPATSPHGSATTWLRSWRVCKGLTPAQAQARLVPALAEADPAFAVAHPELLGCRSKVGPSVGAMVCALLERRLLQGLGGQAEATVLAVAVVAAFALLRGRARPGAGGWLVRVLTRLIAALAGYRLLVHHGPPALRMLSSGQSARPAIKNDTAAGPGAAVRLLLRGLQLVMPTIRGSLLG